MPHRSSAITGIYSGPNVLCMHLAVVALQIQLQKVPGTKQSVTLNMKYNSRMRSNAVPTSYLFVGIMVNMPSRIVILFVKQLYETFEFTGSFIEQMV